MITEPTGLVANNNETIEDIVSELRSEPLAEGGAKPWIHYLADRIEAALKRERERGYVGRGSGDVLAVDSNAGDLHDDETYQKGGEGMKRMSAIAMVRLCETADDWISMICNQCKIRRPSKASYWFNVCEAVFDSLKSRPIRNCDVFSKAKVLEILEDRSFSKEDTIEYLFAEAKGETDGSK